MIEQVNAWCLRLLVAIFVKYFPIIASLVLGFLVAAAVAATLWAILA